MRQISAVTMLIHTSPSRSLTHAAKIHVKISQSECLRDVKCWLSHLLPQRYFERFERKLGLR